MDFPSILKSVAPWLGAAIAGPAGPLLNMAVSSAAKALGASEETVSAVEKAFTGASPEQLFALQNSDQDFKLQMQKLGFENIQKLEALAVDDRKSARDMQVANKSLVPAVLTWFVVGSFVGAMFALFSIEVPLSNRDIVVYMVGQLSGFAAAAVAFWLGTTRASEEKTHMLAKAQPLN